MNKFRSYYAFGAMVIGIAITAIFVYKWTSARETTDEIVIEWMTKQDSTHEATEEFHQEVMSGIEDIKLLADSALIIGRENQQAIFANRYTIIQQIQKDTSLTRDEAFDLLQPFLDGIRDLKRTNGWTPYVNEQP